MDCFAEICAISPVHFILHQLWAVFFFFSVDFFFSFLFLYEFVVIFPMILLDFVFCFWPGIWGYFSLDFFGGQVLRAIFPGKPAVTYLH